MSPTCPLSCLNNSKSLGRHQSIGVSSGLLNCFYEFESDSEAFLFLWSVCESFNNKLICQHFHLFKIFYYHHHQTKNPREILRA
jgi:hypothetical protein